MNISPSCTQNDNSNITHNFLMMGIITNERFREYFAIIYYCEQSSCSRQHIAQDFQNRPLGERTVTAIFFYWLQNNKKVIIGQYLTKDEA